MMNRIYNRSNRLRTASIGALAIACSLSMVTPSFAQEDKTDKKDEEVVIVTGIRQATAKSIDKKKNATSVVEVVTAEDVGKLPGLSIAESLARLPGLAAQRVDGRAQNLSIRGFAPRFAVTLLNGNEMASSGDDRSFEYDQFPGELVNSATVYKTPDASLGSNGLSGTIDIQTIRPLSIKGRKINLSVKSDTNSFGKLVPGSSNSGMRFNGSYINQFMDGKLGIALGYAHLDSPNQKKYFNPWDYGDGNALWVLDNAYNPVAFKTFSGFEAGVASTQTVRDGFLGVIDFRPNDEFRSTLNLFKTKFEQDMNGREFAGVVANWGLGDPKTTLVSGETVRVVDIVPNLVMRKNSRDDDISSMNWANELNLGKWRLRGDFSVSKSERQEVVSEAYAVSETPTTMTITLPTGFDSFGKISTSQDFSNASGLRLTDMWAWGGGYGAYESTASVDDDFLGLRLSGNRELSWGPVESLDLGLLFSERTKDVNVVGQWHTLNGLTTCHSWMGCRPIPAGIVQGTADLSFVGVGNMLSFDVREAINSGVFTPLPPSSRDPRWNWDVNEQVTTYYAKANFRGNMMVPVRGNFGVQVVHSDQSSHGLYVDAVGARNPIAGGTNYTDVLPSLNLIAELSKKTQLRFGLAKQMARPAMVDLRAGKNAAVSASTRLWSGSGGNPDLEPWRANAIDLSLESYFGKATYLAVAAYYKDVTSGVITKSVQYDFTGFANPTGVIPTSNIGTMTTPTNVSGGFVKGIEFSGALEGSLISPVLDGFGVIGSWSLADSNLPGTTATGEPLPTSLEGLSGEVGSLTFYYEKYGFQARIGTRYRSEFNALRHNAFKFVMDSIRPEAITDVQLGYTFDSGPLNGLGILLQVMNVTNQPYVVTQTVDNSTILKEYHEFGTQYIFGLSYKF